jgi:hypothetical protein
MWRRSVTNAPDKLASLLNSALFVDAVCFPGFKREQDLTDAERARGEAWRRWAQQRPRPAPTRRREAR